LSPKEKDSKRKEELKPFTVGSVQPSAAKAKKKSKGPQLEVSEKDFPVLVGIIRGNNAKPFQEEMLRVLAAVEEIAKNGSSEDKADSQKIQKAYGMAVAILDNAKVIR
jgi:hypothetical protein